VDELTDLTTALTTSIDPDVRAGAVTEAVKPYDDENGAWRFAPREAREKAISKIRDEQDAASGELLYRVEHIARRHEVELEPLEKAAMEPPDPFTAWTRRANVVGMSTEANISLGVLSELRLQRFERELAHTKPSEIRTRYAAAQREPYEQENASLIRYIESRHGAGWNGVDLEGDAREAMQGTALREEIRAVRAARIPDDLRAKRATIQHAYKVADLAKARRVISRVPKVRT
jgi:hypothetical protein